MKKLPRTIDPAKLSKSCLALNPHLLSPSSLERAARASILPASTPLAPKAGQDSGKATRGKRRREMNKTEADFARILEAMKLRGEIARYEYEGMTLRWPDGMRYTGDFAVWRRLSEIGWSITIVEIKGAYAWRQDVVKFRAARAHWPEFRFEFWQKVDGEWKETR